VRAESITEAEFQATVVELLAAFGYRHLHVRRTIGQGGRWTTSTNLVGWPDLLAWRPGRCVAIELKSESGRATPEQLEVLASLAEAGIEGRVVRPSGWAGLVEWLR
jgi:hypothetical protein